MLGTIKNVRVDRGFAFIEPEGEGPDVFALRSVFDESLEFDERLMGRRVEFILIQSERGPRAHAVRSTEAKA